MRPIIGALILVLTAFPALAAMSGKTESIQSDITELSLEALMDVTVTIASKKEEKLSETAAAIYVITQEDIRRSGVTNIAEALRMAPGVNVALINSNTWAISVRGFNRRFADKLLVLIDGRSIYRPIFSGSYWHRQNPVLEDIERIEIIRGPGAAIWGANAVNGIINIITKNAKDTQGGLLTGGAGNLEKGFGTLRYGGQVGEDFHYRAYVKGHKRDNFKQTTGESAEDDWHSLQSGFRMDWDASTKDAVTIQGDIFDGESGVVSTFAVPFPPFGVEQASDVFDSGLNVIGRWKHTWSETSDMFLQVYYDHVDSKTHYLDGFGQVTRTLDFDFHHYFQFQKNQIITWGLEYRHIFDDITNPSNIVYNPDSRDYKLFSAFVQDDITLIKDKFKVIVGSKFEHNDFTGFEFQPNGRFIWTPRERHSIWGAISRAVRTPNRSEHDFDPLYSTHVPPNALFPGAPDALFTVVGDKDFDSEELLAYELGYRFLPTDKISIDIAAFYNDYDKLLTFELGPPTLSGTAEDPFLVLPAVVDGDHLTGEAFGLETTFRFNPYPWWKLQASHTFLKMHHRATNSADINPDRFQRTAAENQLYFRSSMDIGRNLDWDTTFRFVDDVPEWDIDYYLEMDMRLAWRPMKNVELSIVGQNLLDNRHPENADVTGFATPVTEVPRSIYGKVTLRF